MRARRSLVAAAASLLAGAPLVAQPATRVPPPLTDSTDAVATLVAQLDLERYKATIKGLTQFGDRRQGT
nr:hypothetical protein [Gemmatimonadaceae bacterium]